MVGQLVCSFTPCRTPSSAAGRAGQAQLTCLTGFHAVCTPKIQMSSTPAHPRFKFSSKLAHRIDISLLHLRALLLAYMACKGASFPAQVIKTPWKLFCVGEMIPQAHWRDFSQIRACLGVHDDPSCCEGSKIVENHDFL